MDAGLAARNIRRRRSHPWTSAATRGYGPLDRIASRAAPL